MDQSARTSTNDWIDCPALMNSGAEYVIPSVGPASAVGPDVRVAGPGPAAHRAAGFHGEYGLGRDRAGSVVACRSRSGSQYTRSRSSRLGNRYRATSPGLTARVGPGTDRRSPIGRSSRSDSRRGWRRRAEIPGIARCTAHPRRRSGSAGFPHLHLWHIDEEQDSDATSGKTLVVVSKAIGPRSQRGSGPDQHRRGIRSRSSADPVSPERAWPGSPWGSG